MAIVLALLITIATQAAAEEVRSFGVLNQRSAVITARYWDPILRYASNKAGVPLELKLTRTAPESAVMTANFGLMGWMNTPLGITAMTTSAIAIGIGADYEIYLLFRFREELARSGDVLTATSNSMLTSSKAILFVALSIIGGYAVLQVSDFAFYNQLSNTVTAMSMFFALFFLCALMMICKPRFIFGDRYDVLFGQVVAGGGK